MPLVDVEQASLTVQDRDAGHLDGPCHEVHILQTSQLHIEEAFSVQFMPADVYYISDLPSKLNWPDVWQIGTVAFLLSFLATLYPSWHASRTQPAEALRYE